MSSTSEQRLGHGLLVSGTFLAANVTFAAGVEKTLDKILSSSFISGSAPYFAPFEIQLVGESSGFEVRSATGIRGFPFGSVSTGTPLTIYPELGSQHDDVILFNSSSMQNILRVLLLK